MGTIERLKEEVANEYAARMNWATVKRDDIAKLLAAFDAVRAERDEWRDRHGCSVIKDGLVVKRLDRTAMMLEMPSGLAADAALQELGLCPKPPALQER